MNTEAGLPTPPERMLGERRPSLTDPLIPRRSQPALAVATFSSRDIIARRHIARHTSRGGLDSSLVFDYDSIWLW